MNAQVSFGQCNEIKIGYKHRTTCLQPDGT